MVQMKEERKTSERELSDEEIANPTDGKFKALVIKMLTERQWSGRWQRDRWEQSPFPSTPVKHLADLRSRANSQQYSSIYEDWRPKIDDNERSDSKKSA